MPAARFIASATLVASCTFGGPAFAASSTEVLFSDGRDVGSRCGDFLAQMHRKPEHVRFVACRSLPDRQGKPLQAVYRVSGRYAAAAEAAMIAAFGLETLKRVCCHWETPPRWFKLDDRREFSVTMVSDETTVGSRADWADIETFEIVVETFTEDI